MDQNPALQLAPVLTVIKALSDQTEDNLAMTKVVAKRAITIRTASPPVPAAVSFSIPNVRSYGFGLAKLQRESAPKEVQR